MNSKKKMLPAFIIAGFILLVIVGIILTYIIQKYTPTKERANLSDHYGISSETDVQIVYNYENIDTRAYLMNGHVYLDYDFIHDNLDSRFYWDSNENLLLYTTASDLISASAGDSTYYVNRDNFDIGRAVVDTSTGKVLVDIEFVFSYSDFLYEYYENPNRIIITNDYTSISAATVKKDSALRVLGGIKSPIMKDLTKGDLLTVLTEYEEWDCVMTADGLIGYVKSETLSDSETVAVTSTHLPTEYTHIFMDEDICLGWQVITNQSANSKVESVLDKSPSLNVVAPTWFYLDDNEGNLHDVGDASYVQACHSRGVKVWAMVNNLDNPDVDSTYILTHTSVRTNLVNQLISLAIQYNIDGINVDLEALSSDVGDGYIQFIRELSIKCHNNGLVLSVDNYVPSNYTNFYNRSEQANYADYIIVMGYDEHYAGSDEVGSVASIGWVTEGVDNTLKQVPANQVILGMPFYTRLWCKSSDSDEDASYSISSTALSMAEGQNLVDDKGADRTWLSEVGQFYATYTENGNTYEIWLEDANSLEERLKVMQDCNLAGCAFWRLGLEQSSVWDTILKYFPTAQ